MTSRGETVLMGGLIYDPESEGEFEALALRGGRIVALGDLDAVRAAVDPDARVIDLGGRFVLPGFVDAHTHLQIGSRVLGLNTSVHTPPHDGIPDVVSTLRARAETVPEGQWVQAQGNLGQNYRLAERRYPDRHDLDAASTRHPIVARFGAHVWTFNTAGLCEIGISRATRLPAPAWLDIDAEGEPTGIVNDLIMVHHELPWLTLPPPPSHDDRVEALRMTARERFTRNGVTTIGEMSDGPEATDILRAAAAAGDVPQRVALYVLDGIDVRDFRADGPVGRFAPMERGGAPRLWCAGVKLAADGGISAREAAVHLAYADRPGHRGQLGLTLDELVAAVRAAEDGGYQLAVHAAGDRAMDQVLDAFAAVRQERGGAAWQQRHRIEHLGNAFATRERLDRSARLGVLPVVNVGFLNAIGDSLRGVYGDSFDREPVYALRTLLELGFPAAAASDFAGGIPEVSDPLFLVWCMLTRRTFDGVILDASQRLTVAEALRAVTADAAWALNLSGRAGVLAVGAFADIAVLSTDPRGLDPDALIDGTVTVDQTWVAGERVWVRTTPI